MRARCLLPVLGLLYKPRREATVRSRVRCSSWPPAGRPGLWGISEDDGPRADADPGASSDQTSHRGPVCRHGLPPHYRSEERHAAPALTSLDVSRGSCPPQPTATYRVDGKPVLWSASGTNDHYQEAWICETSHGRAVVITANAYAPGDGNLSSPRARRDALRLAAVAAYTEPNA